MPRKRDPIQEPVEPSLVAPSLPGAAIAQMNQDARLAYRLLVGGWTFTGFLALVVCLGFYLHPSARAQSAINQNLGGYWDDVWHLAWALGGALIMVGTLRVRYVVELYGNIIFCACLIPYTTSVIQKTGINAPALGLSLGAFVLGVCRCIYIVHFSRRVSLVVHEAQVEEAALRASKAGSK